MRREEAKKVLMLNRQLKPHFLFNSLNNLYALSLKGSDQTATSIALMAEILGFLVYECNEPLIPLSQELDLIKRYIQLEETWYPNNGPKTKFSVSGQTEACQVPTIVLFTLIENAYKHTRNLERPEIKVVIQVYSRRFRCWVSNPKTNSEPNLSTHHGLGLKNIKNQLTLLFPDQHNLEFIQDNNQFTAFIEINH